MQMVLIQETSGSILMEVGTILTETAICRPVGYSLEIPGTILTPVEQCRLVGKKLVETGII